MKTMRTMAMVGLALSLGMAGSLAQSEEVQSWPPFEQVLESIETNLPEVNRAELNAVIVEAILNHYHPRVRLLPADGTEAESVTSGTLERATVFDRAFGYLRVGAVAPGLERQLREAWSELHSGNPLQGLVLDLRFASGQDYQAAAQAADLFVATSQPLVAWRDTVVHATPNQEVVTVPVVVLINQRSAGAAEALAGALREAGVALLVGTQTAGQAHVYREFELPEGRMLRVASEPVLVGDGQSITGGLAPDIEVTVRLADETQYLADPYAVIPGTVAGTALHAERARVNEAELMRQRQPGFRPGLDREAPAPAPARKEEAVVQDPALARGLDLLKGIAIVGRAR